MRAEIQVSASVQTSCNHDVCRSPIEHSHLPRERRIQLPPAIRGIVSFRKRDFGTREILAHVEQVGMIDELAQERDGLERLRSDTSQHLLRLGIVLEELVETELER